MKKKIICTVYTCILSVFVFQSTVFAYIDPGAVSSVIQAIAACFLIGGTAFGIFFNKIKNVLSRKKNVAEESASKIEEKTDDYIS